MENGASCNRTVGGILVQYMAACESHIYVFRSLGHKLIDRRFPTFPCVRPTQLDSWLVSLEKPAGEDLACQGSASPSVDRQASQANGLCQARDRILT